MSDHSKNYSLKLFPNTVSRALSICIFANFMRLKYGAIIVLVSVVIVFVRSLDLGPYRDHHRGPSSSASLEFLDEFEVIVSPQKESWLIEKIDAAEKKVWISVYSFTLPSLREALLRAKNRGVEVKVIVEKFPF